jgi:hypothetical protein
MVHYLRNHHLLQIMRSLFLWYFKKFSFVHWYNFTLGKKACMSGSSRIFCKLIVFMYCRCLEMRDIVVYEYLLTPPIISPMLKQFLCLLMTQFFSVEIGYIVLYVLVIISLYTLFPSLYSAHYMQSVKLEYLLLCLWSVWIRIIYWQSGHSCLFWETASYFCSLWPSSGHQYSILK